jgi:predicted Fe-Mo cluster-binding NifX family protein
MKICIPTEDDHGLEAVLAGHYGRAPYFTLIDTDTQDVKSVPNPGCHRSDDHDRNCHHIDILQAHQVGAVVGGHIGHRAATGLRAAGIEVWSSPSSHARDALRAYQEGTLEPAPVGGGCEGGRHGHRHGPGRGRGQPRALAIERRPG